MPDETIKLDDLVKASVKDGRVDIVHLAKNLGLEVYSVPLPDNDSGHITYDAATDKAYIQVNKNHAITRQRFTIAHEISHFVKHRTQLQSCGQLDRTANYKNAEEIKMETEADKEAADILMPKHVVEEFLLTRKWTKNTRFNAGMIDDVAEQFRVSRAMVALRLRTLGFTVPYISFA